MAEWKLLGVGLSKLNFWVALSGEHHNCIRQVCADYKGAARSRGSSEVAGPATSVQDCASGLDVRGIEQCHNVVLGNSRKEALVASGSLVPAGTFEATKARDVNHDAATSPPNRHGC